MYFWYYHVNDKSLKDSIIYRSHRISYCCASMPTLFCPEKKPSTDYWPCFHLRCISYLQKILTLLPQKPLLSFACNSSQQLLKINFFSNTELQKLKYDDKFTCFLCLPLPKDSFEGLYKTILYFFLFFLVMPVW